jgi:hypothetical protein
MRLFHAYEVITTIEARTQHRTITGCGEPLGCFDQPYHGYRRAIRIDQADGAKSGRQ